MNVKKLSYSFTGFDGLYVPSYYHKIDLSDFRINVNKSEQTFFTCTPSLIIKNYNNIFSDIAGASSTVTFNLTLQKYTNYYTFKLANNLYVNKQTLLLSSEPKDGYVKTKYIYFPVNEMHNQDNYEAYFSFTKFGLV